MSCTRALNSKIILRGVTLAALVALILIAFSGIAPARASSDPAIDVTLEAAEAPQEQAEGSDPEANLPFLFAVFFVTWAAFFGYVFVMSRRQREMQREIEALKRALSDREEQALHAEREPGTPR